ncbi:MAG: primosomal protein N' [Actinomycetes bacterium]
MSTASSGSTTPAAARARAKAARSRPGAGLADQPAAVLPVARVAVDVSLAHLDRPFDYLVPARLDAQAVPGCRVRVRFSGQLVDGFLLSRAESSQHVGRLSPLAKVVSDQPALSPEVARLASAVADRYGGTLADVLRLAVPPRHAAAEKAASAQPVVARPAVSAPEPGPWLRYPTGPALVSALCDGRPARAVWAALPGTEWIHCLAVAVAATASAGRGALVVVPDLRDVERVAAGLVDQLGADSFVVLTADSGPRERYRRWMAVRRGDVRVVVGTRAAMFAPVTDLGLAVVWDDGDDLHSEPRAPYPHVREVLALRAHLDGAALLVGGFAVTAEGASLVERGFARPVAARRTTVRTYAPRVRAIDDAAGSHDEPSARAARLPTLAWRTARDALARGPVLVQVPRGGYVPAVGCARCHARAVCGTCHGPLGLAVSGGAPVCRWCARVDPAWRCAECGFERLRAMVVGARRTADELGRAFTPVPVVTSGAGDVKASVPDRPALVVATPGAEPVAEGGYAAALLLDTWALLGRHDLRAGEEALRRWLAAAALVRPADQGGHVLVVADPASRPVQALVRWDPVGAAQRELADRVAAGLPPAVRLAVLTGSAAAVDDVLHRAALPGGIEVLGPAVEPPHPGAPADRDQPHVRAVVRSPLSSAAEMVTCLRRAQGERSLRKEAEHVRLQIDPVQLG